MLLLASVCEFQAILLNSAPNSQIKEGKKSNVYPIAPKKNSHPEVLN